MTSFKKLMSMLTLTLILFQGPQWFNHKFKLKHPKPQWHRMVLLAVVWMRKINMVHRVPERWVLHHNISNHAKPLLSFVFSKDCQLNLIVFSLWFLFRFCLGPRQVQSDHHPLCWSMPRLVKDAGQSPLLAAVLKIFMMCRTSVTQQYRFPKQVSYVYLKMPYVPGCVGCSPQMSMGIIRYLLRLCSSGKAKKRVGSPSNSFFNRWGFPLSLWLKLAFGSLYRVITFWFCPWTSTCCP